MKFSPVGHSGRQHRKLFELSWQIEAEIFIYHSLWHITDWMKVAPRADSLEFLACPAARLSMLLSQNKALGWEPQVFAISSLRWMLRKCGRTANNLGDPTLTEHSQVQEPCEAPSKHSHMETTLLPILYLRKLRLRKTKKLAQRRTPRTCWGCWTQLVEKTDLQWVSILFSAHK